MTWQASASANPSVRHRSFFVFELLLLLLGSLVFSAPAYAQSPSGTSRDRIQPASLPLGSASSQPAPLQLSRPIRSWEFLPVVGQRAALFGHETGQLEAWVYPLKILRDFHLRFLLANKTVPAESLARTLIVRPESATIIYSGDDFSVRETLFVPVYEQGAVLTFEIDTAEPFEIEAAFTPDFQLEWPAALGATYYNWDPKLPAYVFGEETKKYVAIVGSPTAANPEFAYDDNYSKSDENTFRMGRIDHGRQTELIVIAASTQGEEAALKTYRRLSTEHVDLTNESAKYYRDYLARTLNVTIPDRDLQRAYDWSRISTIQGLVENPGLGTGLVAGYRTSGTSQRPGFAWFFGRDSMWTSFALNASGDFATTKQALEFVGQFQRDDGRMPHEIAQSAKLVDWFHAYPYAFASADATPLYIISVNDYVSESGDIEFARTNWDRLTKAYQFLRSTYDDHGLPRNFGVGHGWVEGGPLLPVHTEYYQSGLGVQAIRALAHLAQLTGKDDIGRDLSQAFEQQRVKVEDAFWAPDQGIYAFALDRESQRINETSVLTTVPMWFGLADPKRVNQMINHLVASEIAADWGMRIIANRSIKYNGGGYHFGAVWPLFTGWASVGEYRYHRADAAYANLRVNALLTLDGALGHVTEVLSGDVFESLSTSSPHQIWSAAMVVSPVLRGLFGLDADASANRLTFAPHIPAAWNSFSLQNARVGSTAVDLSVQREANTLTLEAKASSATTVLFSPALSPRTQVISAELNGHRVPFHITKTETDQHVEVDLPLSTSISTLRFHLKNDFGLSYDNPLPELGAPGSALHLLSESWNDARTELTLSLAGIPGHHYVLNIWNPSQIASVDGAPFRPAFGLSGDEGAGQAQCGAHAPERDCGMLGIDFPAVSPTASTTGFVTRSLVVRFQSSK
jgi:glycogen debranching enzyme